MVRAFQGCYSSLLVVRLHSLLPWCIHVPQSPKGYAYFLLEQTNAIEQAIIETLENLLECKLHVYL